MPNSTDPTEQHSHADSINVGLWLRQFLAGDQSAFARLVQYYTPLVLAVTLRRTSGNFALAQEAAQCVFIDFARRAATLRADASLGGWLHQRALHAAADLMKRESRRVQREQKATQLEPEIWRIDSAGNTADDSNPQWTECRSMVDDALDRLSLPERTAVLLRYAEGEDLPSIAAMLGCSVDAAKKRASRALDKVRRFISRKHPTLSLAALMAGLAMDHTQAGTLTTDRLVSAMISESLHQTARLGPVTLWERSLPSLQSAAAGSAAAGLLWGWPLLERWHSSNEITPTAAVTGIVSPPPPVTLHFPHSPPQPRLQQGLSLEQIVNAIAALTEAPSFPNTWTRMQFFRGQLSKEQYPAFLAQIHKRLSDEGWNEFIKRDWAEDFFQTWAATDVVAALEFILGTVGEKNFIDKDRTALTTLAGNIVWRCYVGAEEGKGNPQLKGLTQWAVNYLNKEPVGAIAMRQGVILYRGGDLARYILESGDADALGNLIEIVNQHGVKWLDDNADHLKTKEAVINLFQQLPKLASVARRAALETSLIRRLANFDYPKAKEIVEATTDAAKRWEWAEAVARPVNMTTAEGKRIVPEAVKQRADWWCDQIPPGKEAECLKQIVHWWSPIDPSWTFQWLSGRTSRAETLTLFQEQVAYNANQVATFGKDLGMKELKHRIGFLNKVAPSETSDQVRQLLDTHKASQHLSALTEALQP